MQRKLILGLFTLFFSANVFCVPHEIVIVRHADKWLQKDPGPYLSPKGQVRAEKLAVYYINRFGKPDFIFASKPVPSKTGSHRPLQTVMPLANALTFQNLHPVLVQTPYVTQEYKQLAHLLLTQKRYANKNIVVCFHRPDMDALAHALGVTQTLPVWQKNVFDTVFVLQYKHGKLASFQILKNQYPVLTKNLTWAELANRIT